MRRIAILSLLLVFFAAERGIANTNGSPENASVGSPAAIGMADLPTLTARGFDFLQQGKLDEAVEAFSVLLDQYPDAKEARFGLGTVYIRQDKYREALDILVPMMEENPEDVSLYNNVAWLYATAKDPTVRDGKKAIAMAQAALLRRPGDYHVWSTLSEAYYVNGQYDKAMRAAEEALTGFRLAGAQDFSNLQTYYLQLDKCRKAADAMSVFK